MILAEAVATTNDAPSAPATRNEPAIARRRGVKRMPLPLLFAAPRRADVVVLGRARGPRPDDAWPPTATNSTWWRDSAPSIAALSEGGSSAPRLCGVLGFAAPVQREPVPPGRAPTRPSALSGESPGVSSRLAAARGTRRRAHPTHEKALNRCGIQSLTVQLVARSRSLVYEPPRAQGVVNGCRTCTGLPPTRRAGPGTRSRVRGRSAPAGAGSTGSAKTPRGSDRSPAASAGCCLQA